MGLIRQLFDGSVLVCITVAIHSLGAVAILSFLANYKRVWLRHPGLGFTVMSLAGIVGSLICLHLAEITVWALYYYWKGLLPDFETAAYYSIMTYTTVGYGDVVLPKAWRLEGTSEALVGILMAAWSTALLIQVVSRFHQKVLEWWEPSHGE